MHLSPERINISGGTQARVKLNEQTVTEYADAMRQGAKFPPVIVFHDGKDHWLADGFHRFHAARRIEAKTIDAELCVGDVRDAILYAVGANAQHGLQRTNADKREAVWTLLDDAEWRKWTDREIARKVHVSHTYVADLRREYEAQAPGNVATALKHAQQKQALTGAKGLPSGNAATDSVRETDLKAPADGGSDAQEGNNAAPTAQDAPQGDREWTDADAHAEADASLQEQLAAALEQLEAYMLADAGVQQAADTIAQLRKDLAATEAARDTQMERAARLASQIQVKDREIVKLRKKLGLQ